MASQFVSRFTFRWATVLAVASAALLICLHFVSAGAEEAAASRLTFEGLQVNRSGISSSFTITNLSSFPVNLIQSYRADAAPDVEIYALSDYVSEVGGSRTYNLAGIEQLPDGFRGKVIISSNQPLTGTAYAMITPTPTPEVTPTPAQTVTTTPTESSATPTAEESWTPNPSMPTFTPPAPEMTPFQIEIDAAQSRFGSFSRIRVSNLGSAAASPRFAIFDENGLEQQGFVDLLAANQSRQYDLEQEIRGSVKIEAFQPITAVLLPTANFFATRHEGSPPFAVQFANTSFGATYDNVFWDFGDGQTSMEMTPTHTYAITGTYSVKLTVSGAAGSDTITKHDLIKVHSFPPIHPDGWDLNFGDYGRLNTGCSWSFPGVLFSVQQPDGGLLFAMQCNGQNVIQRYLENGTIDLTFAQGGQLALAGGSISGIISEQSGKIVIAQGLTLRRYNANGSIDSTFGNAGVSDVFSNSSQVSTYTQLALQSDGKIVAVGQKDLQPIITRYSAAGQLDSTFNQQGYLLTEISDKSMADESANRWQELVLYPTGTILVGRSNIELVDPFTGELRRTYVLARYDSNGKLDAAFGVNGIRQLENNRFDDIAAQPDGKIVGLYGGSVIRLHYNGLVDESFQSYYALNLMRLDAQGRVYMASYGSATWDDYMLRLSPNGALDTTFGNNGILAWSGDARIYAAFLLPDDEGRLLIQAASRNSSDLAFVRYIDNHPAPPPVSKPLTLLYAVLDNNLGEDATRLINNVEVGVRAGSNVRLLVDGPGDNDVYLYNVMQDSNPFCPSASNPSCDGRYAEGINFWHLANENSAHPDSLYQFLVDGINAFSNTSSINVALIGHGSGWSANVLPGQPSIWRGQNDTLGGMLWDDHPGAGQSESRSLSTLMLGQALSWASAQTGRTIDLLYLDGCSMGMAEVAYEVRDSAKLLLASPNIDWASFNYDELLPEVATLRGQELGKRWLALEASRLRSSTGYPFTLSLVDLSKLSDLATATDGLADALQSVLPSQRTAISSAFQLSDKFESNYDGVINNQDSYVDLGDFAQQLQEQFSSNSTVVNAVQSLQSTLSSTIVAKEHENGTPWMFQDQQWVWNLYSGLAIYAPLGQDEVRRQIFYNADNLSLAADTSWDEFLTAYWAGAVQSAAASMPVCHQTSDGCVGLANPLPVQAEPVYNVFMPVVAR